MAGADRISDRASRDAQARATAAAAEAARQREAASRQQKAAAEAAARQAAARAEAARQTKSQVERQESAAAEAAARQAAARAEAGRITKSQAERQDMAEYERVQWIIKNGPRSADAMDAWLKAPAFKPSPASTTTGSNKPGGSPSPSPAPANTVSNRATNTTVNPEPSVINIPDPPKFNAIKAAPIDTVVFVDETFSSEFITDLLFEDVGGQELLSIARDDTVNGQEVVYQPFKNLGILRDTYDINNLLKLQETSDKFFANFIIKLLDKIPEVGNGPNGKNFYFDIDSGNGIIEFVNMRDDEQVEIQISNAGIIEEVGI